MISFEDGERNLDWLALTDALAEGHLLPRAEVSDTFLYEGDNTLLNRSAWIAGMGIVVKCATIFPRNKAAGIPAIGGAVNLFSGTDGTLEAILDFHLVTKWKTAGDSLLGARRLARPDSKKILIVGAGTVGHSLLEAYGALFPNAKFQVWNRSPDGTKRFVEKHPHVTVAASLPKAVEGADIVTCATMSKDPIIQGGWLRPGQHIDLIGAYRPDMREADDEAMVKARLFVDIRASTIDHIGELRAPIAAGIITPDDVIADFYEIDQMTRNSDDEITLFKNGGGAHLDLMTSRYILSAYRSEGK